MRFPINILAVSLLFLTGCGGSIRSAARLAPQTRGFSYVSLIQDATRGGTGADVAFARQPGEIVVGHEYLVEGGRTHQHYFRGAVKFDLGEIVRTPDKVIDRSVLTYRLTATDARDAAGTAEPLAMAISCAKEVLSATEPWGTGETMSDGVLVLPSPVPGELGRRLPSPEGGGTLYTVDVTDFVRRWVVRPEADFGLVLRGEVDVRTQEPDSRTVNLVLADRSRCTSRYTNFELLVEYTMFR